MFRISPLHINKCEIHYSNFDPYMLIYFYRLNYILRHLFITHINIKRRGKNMYIQIWNTKWKVLWFNYEKLTPFK